MNREKAFAIAGEALDLAQYLDYPAKLRNPNHLKRRYRWFANKFLLSELKDYYTGTETASRDAYALYNKLIDWANTYPLEGENK